MFMKVTTREKDITLLPSFNSSLYYVLSFTVHDNFKFQKVIMFFMYILIFIMFTIYILCEDSKVFLFIQ